MLRKKVLCPSIIFRIKSGPLSAGIRHVVSQFIERLHNNAECLLVWLFRSFAFSARSGAGAAASIILATSRKITSPESRRLKPWARPAHFLTSAAGKWLTGSRPAGHHVAEYAGGVCSAASSSPGSPSPVRNDIARISSIKTMLRRIRENKFKTSQQCRARDPFTDAHAQSPIASNPRRCRRCGVDKTKA